MVSTRRADIVDWLGRPTRAKAIAAVLFTVAMYAWRSGDGITHPQLWAEDGRVFFSEATTYGPWSLVTPYAGYLHTVQRIIALLSSPFTATLAPERFIAGTVLVVAWVAATVATAEDRHAWLLASLLMVVPVGGEIFGNLTNVQWFGQVGLLAVTVTPSPASRIVRINQLLFVLAFAFDGPFSIFAAPFAAWRLWRGGRDGHGWAVGLMVIAGALVQSGLAVQESSPYEGVREPWHLATTMVDRWIGQSAHRGLTSRPPAWRADAVFAAALLAAAPASGALARKMLLYAALALAATFARFVPDSHYFDAGAGGERYFYLPRLALAWCLVSCAVRLRWTSSCGVLGLAMMALSFDHWERAPLPVLPWRDGAAELDRGQAASILINPSRPGDGDPYPWMVIVPARP